MPITPAWFRSLWPLTEQHKSESIDMKHKELPADQAGWAFDPRVMAIHRLRVNVKSLAAEAKIIRRETQRCGYQYEQMLVNHRRGYLRDEARYAQLALAYVRGVPRIVVENGASRPVDDARLISKVFRFIQATNAEIENLKRWAVNADIHEAEVTNS